MTTIPLLAVLNYQECQKGLKASPCSKQYTGVAFDNHCCIVQEKHKRCLGCKSAGTRPNYNTKYADQLATGETVVEP